VTPTTHIAIHCICRNVIFLRTLHEQLEARRAILCEWTEEVLESQRPSISFGEAAARYVGAAQPVIEAHKQTMADEAVYHANGEAVDDYMLEEARDAQVAELWRLKQETNDRDMATGAVRAKGMNIDSAKTLDNRNQSYEQEQAYKKESQEALDRRLAERLQAEDELPPLLDYTTFERQTKEQGRFDRKLAERLATQGDLFLHAEAIGPRTRTQAAKEDQHEIDSVLAEIIAVEDDERFTKSIAHETLSSLSADRARYKEAKRKARQDSIG
jgi:hypothetical protein